MAKTRRLRLMGMLLAAGAACAATLSQDVNTSALGVTCPNDCVQQAHLESYSGCGSCSQDGQIFYGTVPETTHVPKDVSPTNGIGDINFFDEAVWMSPANSAGVPIQESPEIEAGYIGGWWAYSAPPQWIPDDEVIPYVTTNDGAVHVLVSAHPLTRGDAVNIQIYGDGNAVEVNEAGAELWNCIGTACADAVPITGRRDGWMQGEVHLEDSSDLGTPWLDNCVGQTFTMKYLHSGTWSDWGNIHLTYESDQWYQGSYPALPPFEPSRQQAFTESSVSPYTSSTSSAYQWTNSGGC